MTYQEMCKALFFVMNKAFTSKSLSYFTTVASIITTAAIRKRGLMYDWRNNPEVFYDCCN